MTWFISLVSVCGELLGHHPAARDGRRLAVADRLDDAGLDQDAAVEHRREGLRELDRRHGDALAEGAVGEVDLRATGSTPGRGRGRRPRWRRRCPIGSPKPSVRHVVEQPGAGGLRWSCRA